MVDITVDRLVAILGGQCIGVCLLIAVGLVPFSDYGMFEDEHVRNEIGYGIKIIRIFSVITLVALLVGYIIIRCLSSELQQKYVNVFLWSFILLDLASLLFVVCQQGGLSRSMFLPVFFLIPTAYMAIDHPNIYKMCVLLVALGLCVLISYFVSRNNVTVLQFPFFSVRVTDFSMLHHKGYNFSFLIVSVISLLTPALQLGYLKFK